MWVAHHSSWPLILYLIKETVLGNQKLPNTPLLSKDSTWEEGKGPAFLAHELSLSNLQQEAWDHYALHTSQGDQFLINEAGRNQTQKGLFLWAAAWPSVEGEILRTGA